VEHIIALQAVPGQCAVACCIRSMLVQCGALSQQHEHRCRWRCVCQVPCRNVQKWGGQRSVRCVRTWHVLFRVRRRMRCMPLFGCDVADRSLSRLHVPSKLHTSGHVHP